MLSNQTPQLSPNHRRQNSSPTTSNTAVAKASYSPAPSNQQHPHRRGLSVDFAMLSQGRQPLPQQDNGSVHTNQGPYQQQNMRATQMPASSRPGRQYACNFEDVQGQALRRQTEPDIYELPETIDPQFDLFALVAAENSNTALQSNVEDANNFFLQLEQKHRATTQPQIPQRPQIADRYPLTPLTEASQSQAHGFPLLTLSSPSHHGSNATIKASQSTAMTRGSSCQDSFAMARRLSNETHASSPASTVPLRCSTSFDMAPMPSPTFLDISDLDMDFSACVNDYSSSNYSPTTNRASPAMSSFQSSPELAPVSLFGDSSEIVPQFPSHFAPDLAGSPNATTPKRKANSPKKVPGTCVQSDDGDESAFNPMDYVINDTGITEEEINAHVQGPDVSGKYSCLYDGCKNGLFGRKENIRAHVQTHLDDRRFRCDVCYNRFVRPNDLKRHWNIHLNKRDFKCICKAAFNRHDALKRHRERSEWCESGGTRGSPDSPKKEEKKRGRPKKIAPTETQERRERKAHIRRQVLKKKEASAPSSVASSHPSPPPDFDVPELQRNQLLLNKFSPTMAAFTPPASPGQSVDDIFSPMYSQTSYTPKRNSMSPPPTRGSMTSSLGLGNNSVSDGTDFGMDLFGEREPSYVNSPPKSNASQYGTPPELDLGSSPPASNFMDFGSSNVAERMPQSSQGTIFFDDMIMKTQEDFDKVYPLFESNPTSFPNTKSNDVDVFRDTIHNELEDPYWVAA